MTFHVIEDEKDDFYEKYNYGHPKRRRVGRGGDGR
jgi:hypothetical protein